MFGLPTPLLVIGGCLAVGALGMLGALFLWGKTVKDNTGTFFQEHVLPFFDGGDTVHEAPVHSPLDSLPGAGLYVPATAHPTLLDRMMPTYENKTGLDPL